MNIEYGFLPYDCEKDDEIPKKTFHFTTDKNDARSVLNTFSDDVFENLNGKEKFTFYVKGDNDIGCTYQVDFTKESRTFFETELFDDLQSILEK